MTRKNLLSLIVLDAIVMALAIGLMAYRYQALRSVPVSALAQSKPVQQAIESGKTLSEKEPAPASEPAETSSLEAVQQREKTSVKRSRDSRNICFTYRNSNAKKVEIIGDFTSWIPRKMTKGASNTWKITLALAPGDYAYNYVVNGKPVRDPNNQKVCDSGRGFPNSFLKVKPLSNDNKKAE